MMYFIITDKDDYYDNDIIYVDGLNEQNMNVIETDYESYQYFFTDALHILSELTYDGYFLKEITLPIDDSDFKMIDMQPGWRSNKIIVGKKYLLSDFQTWKFLVENGADISAQANYAVRKDDDYGHLEIVKFLGENGADISADNNYAIIMAASNGHLEIVKYLAENGADISAGDNYAIMVAASNGHLEIVKY